jgi:hypothetical protein
VGHPAADHPAADHPAADGSAHDGPGTGTAPDADSQIYLWNPGATTDTFPALPEPGRPGPDD